MKKKVLAAILISMGILAGCGGEEEVPTSNPLGPVHMGEEDASTPATTPEEPKEAEESSSQPEEADEPDLGSGKKANGENHPITERTVVNGQMQSYLTGEWKDASVAKRRPMALMIPNNKAALPQYGISQASIIYEAPVEGRTSRLMAFFEDYDDLERVGPARSSRDYYVYEAMAYDAIYCNWGLAVPYVSDLINSTRVDNVSRILEGIKKGADEAFERYSRSGYKTEYTGYLVVEGYKKAVNRLGYATEYTDRFEQAFTFADEGYTATYDSYPSATVIYPGGTGSNSSGYGWGSSNGKSNCPCFTYNEDEGLYYRTEYGAAQVDEYNGEQLAVSNVVFKICHGEVRDANDYLAFGVHGTGDAYVFTNGKVIKGTWKHEGDYSTNLFLDENGNEIVFNQGKTWICCIWKEYSEHMSWE